MSECSKCGKESMSFSCKYCGKKFCSEHRLPENHECDGLQKEIKEEKKEQSKKWFKDNEVKNPAPSQQKKQKEFRKPSMTSDLIRGLKRNTTLSIIGFTTLVFLIQISLNNFPNSGLNETFYNLLILNPEIGNIAARPWTLLTVMILHGGLFHLFANMITFYFFGSPIEKIVGGKKLLEFYLAAGVLSSIGFVGFRNLLYLLHGSELTCIVGGMCGGKLGILGPAVGASGAVVASFAVVSRIYPDAEVLLYFFIPLKIKTAFYFFAVFEGLNMFIMFLGYTVPVIGGIAFSAHFTGLLVGLWYGEKLKNKVSARKSGFELLPR